MRIFTYNALTIVTYNVIIVSAGSVSEKCSYFFVTEAFVDDILLRERVSLLGNHCLSIIDSMDGYKTLGLVN